MPSAVHHMDEMMVLLDTVQQQSGAQLGILADHVRPSLVHYDPNEHPNRTMECSQVLPMRERKLDLPPDVQDCKWCDTQYRSTSKFNFKVQSTRQQ